MIPPGSSTTPASRQADAARLVRPPLSVPPCAPTRAHRCWGRARAVAPACAGAVRPEPAVGSSAQGQHRRTPAASRSLHQRALHQPPRPQHRRRRRSRRVHGREHAGAAHGVAPAGGARPPSPDRRGPAMAAWPPQPRGGAAAGREALAGGALGAGAAPRQHVARRQRRARAPAAATAAAATAAAAGRSTGRGDLHSPRRRRRRTPDGGCRRGRCGPLRGRRWRGAGGRSGGRGRRGDSAAAGPLAWRWRRRGAVGAGGARGGDGASGGRGG